MDYPDDVTSTTLPPNSQSSSSTLRLYDIFIPLLGVFIITLNALVVFSSGLLLKKRQEPRSTYLFLGNVGLSDLMTGCAVLFGQFYPRHIRSDLSCSIQMGMIVSSTLVSIFSITLVAIDRFFYILYGMKYQQYVYPNRARFSILITWIIGGLIGFLPAMISSLRGTMRSDQCWFVLLNAEYILSTTIIGIIPIFIIVGLYSLILYKALKKISELKSSTNAPERGASTSNQLRYFKGSTANILNHSNSPAVSAAQNTENEELTTLRGNKQATKSIFNCFGCFWKRQKQSDELKDDSNQSNRQPSQWKAIKVVMFTTGAFIVTWTPYFIASTIYVYCDHENNPQFCNGLKIAIASPLAILGFSNSLLNPIIYAWWHTGFRTQSIRIYSKRLENVKCCKWIFPSSTPPKTSTSGTSATDSNSNQIVTSASSAINITTI